MKNTMDPKQMEIVRPKVGILTSVKRKDRRIGSAKQKKREGTKATAAAND